MKLVESDTESKNGEERIAVLDGKFADRLAACVSHMNCDPQMCGDLQRSLKQQCT